MQKHINYFDVPYRNVNTNEEVSNFFIPNLALSYGTAFKTLVDKYQNYNPKIITITDSKEGLLRLIQSHYFTLADLALYLDVNDQDPKAINLYNNNARGLLEAIEKYESIYGPLLLVNHESNVWTWRRSWPWERGNN